MSLTAFLLSYGFMICVMSAAWLVQQLTCNAGWVDACWTYGAGVMGAGLALWPATSTSGRQVLVAILILLWAARLGTHIALRVRGAAEDRRYAMLRVDWGSRFHSRLFWFLQAQALVAAMLGLSIAAAAHAAGPFPALPDLVGGLTLAAGIAGEGLADLQLTRFKQDKGNAGRICDVGLWGWSRHPNYFFEWVSWLAYPVIALSGDGFFPALIAPVVMYAVLVHGSGIPPLEQQMAESRGAAFARYKARTSAFFPLPPKNGRNL